MSSAQRKAIRWFRFGVLKQMARISQAASLPCIAAAKPNGFKDSQLAAGSICSQRTFLADNFLFDLPKSNRRGELYSDFHFAMPRSFSQKRITQIIGHRK